MGDRAEPFAAIQRAEEHRRFWRPDTPRLVLLAESHVHTAETELNCTLKGFNGFPVNMPTGFVRLVYCLGYGENRLIEGAIVGRNTGTPQFWQVFNSCIHSGNSNGDFHSVQASRICSLEQRVANKIRLLSALQARGIWLLDASVAALYQQGQPKPSYKLRCSAIQKSWDDYVQHLVAEADPEAILCIGIGVARILQSRLDQLQIPWDAVPQPQARLSRPQHSEVRATYHSVSRDPGAIRQISRRWL